MEAPDKTISSIRKKYLNNEKLLWHHTVPGYQLEKKIDPAWVLLLVVSCFIAFVGLMMGKYFLFFVLVVPARMYWNDHGNPFEKKRRNRSKRLFLITQKTILTVEDGNQQRRPLKWIWSIKLEEKGLRLEDWKGEEFSIEPLDNPRRAKTEIERIWRKHGPFAQTEKEYMGFAKQNGLVCKAALATKGQRLFSFQGKIKEWQFAARVSNVGVESSLVHIKLRGANPLKYFLEMRKEGGIDQVAKLAGVNDFQLGNRMLDDYFHVATNNSELTKLIFDDASKERFTELLERGAPRLRFGHQKRAIQTKNKRKFKDDSAVLDMFLVEDFIDDNDEPTFYRDESLESILSLSWEVAEPLEESKDAFVFAFETIKGIADNIVNLSAK